MALPSTIHGRGRPLQIRWGFSASMLYMPFAAWYSSDKPNTDPFADTRGSLCQGWCPLAEE